MAWIKLIKHYLGIPYYSNIHHIKTDNIALVGKGNYKEIKKAIKEFPDKRIGIDCSGLVCQLLQLPYNPRKTNADMLTSPPLSHQISLSEVKSGDLIRQKNGHHVVIIIKKNKESIDYIHSSRKTKGVVIGTEKLSNKEFFKDGVFRLFLFD
jgi:hypothetical protein